MTTIAEIIGWKFNHQAGMRTKNGVITEFPGGIPSQADQDAWTAEYTDRVLKLVPITELRSERNALLASTDWRDLPSYAGTKQAEWRVYRQALRDLTSGLDTVEKVKAVTWPEKPTG